jgi:hypothetical protein
LWSAFGLLEITQTFATRFWIFSEYGAFELPGSFEAAVTPAEKSVHIIAHTRVDQHVFVFGGNEQAAVSLADVVEEIIITGPPDPVMPAPL